ncbi:MAG: STAS domain-containing protein [Myxococcota bacterium]
MTETRPTIPVLKMWDQLLVALQGDVSDRQADDLSRSVLRRIRDVDVSGLILDVTGVHTLDSHLCAVLARLAASARLMGVRSVMCGLTPEVVMTLQAMDIELDEIETMGTIEEAMEAAGIQHTLLGDRDYDLNEFFGVKS